MTDSMMTKTMLFVFVLALLAGCAKRPIGDPVDTANPELKLAFMFEHEGCKVYRFLDAGRYHYFTNCRGSVATHQSCGKNCSYEERVESEL